TPQMANVRAERLLKIPAEPSPELRIPGAAAQTRVVSMVGIRLGSWESVRAFKGIICDDISEFESYMPSHAVGSLWRVYPSSCSSHSVACRPFVVLGSVSVCRIGQRKRHFGSLSPSAIFGVSFSGDAVAA